MDTFYKIVPQEILPKEYGGTAEASTVLAGKKTNSTFTNYILKIKFSEQNRKLLDQNMEFFKEQERQTNDESKRVEKSTDFNKIFGLEGTFKKLEVD